MTTDPHLRLADHSNPFTFRHKVFRYLWGIVSLIAFRASPRLLNAWRVWLLRMFGAKIGRNCVVHPTVKVWAPWNLRMGDYCALSASVDCYCMDVVILGDQVTISQYTHLCAGSHDIEDPTMKLVTNPIRIESQAWVCSGAFVGPGVTIGEGSVVAARGVVVRDVEDWSVVGGNPAKFIKRRRLRKSEQGDEAKYRCRT
jgi:putative colanic acid biosynthesis acetyltransferase WcaF